MTIDLKSIFIEQFTRMFESHLGLIVIVFAIAIIAFVYRHYIAFYLDLSKREDNKLTEIILVPLLFIAIATIGYLYIKQDLLLLSIAISVILTYFLYMVGIFDMIVEKLEGR